MEKLNLTLNGKAITALPGQTILEVAREHFINIPTLCHLEIEKIGYHNQPASCRVCVVELENGRLVPSCATEVYEGMKIRTESIHAIKARRNVVELILSNHPSTCLTCEKNTKCQLQQLAHDLGVREIKYEGEHATYHHDKKSKAIVREPEKCILCSRCLTMCNEIQTVHALTNVNRGFSTYVGSAFQIDMHHTTCTFCGQCLSICPTGALTEVNNTDLVLDSIADPDKYVVVQTAPAVRVALGEEFGMPPGTNVTGKMVSALRNLGFDGVFDTNWAADLTIVEESAELIHRLQNGGPFPMFTSCCPAWVTFMETQFYDMVNLPSSAKSPHEMFGAVAKSYLADKLGIDPAKMFVVSVMPCVAKKWETIRHELRNEAGLPDVDTVITTRELARIIKETGINFNDLEDSDFDQPLGESTGGGTIFGATGGVLEATLRACQDLLNEEEMPVLEFESLRGFDGIKTTQVTIGGKTLNIAVTNGLGNVRQLLEAQRRGELKMDVIEIMACPGGCINGAGQPYHRGDLSILKKRSDAIFAADRQKKTRISIHNASVKKLYEEYLGDIYGAKAQELLHTTYRNRPKY